MKTLNGDVKLAGFTVHGDENTAVDGTEDGIDGVAIQVTNKCKVR